MTKRLQVVLDAQELRAVQQAARHEGVSVAEWVRVALRAARGARSTRQTERKLEAVRTAVAHAFPTSDIAQMLSEIEQGR